MRSLCSALPMSAPSTSTRTPTTASHRRGAGGGNRALAPLRQRRASLPHPGAAAPCSASWERSRARARQCGSVAAVSVGDMGEPSPWPRDAAKASPRLRRVQQLDEARARGESGVAADLDLDAAADTLLGRAAEGDEGFEATLAATLGCDGDIDPKRLTKLLSRLGRRRSAAAAAAAERVVDWAAEAGLALNVFHYSSLVVGDIRARWVTLRARWVTLRELDG
jgi:hypothetical protein